MLDEQEFHRLADESLEALNRKLIRASDQYGFETDFQAGALSVEFEDPPGRFVVSPNAPVRQIWVSALSKSYKLTWDADRKAFVLPETGESLEELMGSRVSDQLGEDVDLG